MFSNYLNDKRLQVGNPAAFIMNKYVVYFKSTPLFKGIVFAKEVTKEKLLEFRDDKGAVVAEYLKDSIFGYKLLSLVDSDA